MGKLNTIHYVAYSQPVERLNGTLYTMCHIHSSWNDKVEYYSLCSQYTARWIVRADTIHFVAFTQSMTWVSRTEHSKEIESQTLCVVQDYKRIIAIVFDDSAFFLNVVTFDMTQIEIY